MARENPPTFRAENRFSPTIEHLCEKWLNWRKIGRAEGGYLQRKWS